MKNNYYEFPIAEIIWLKSANSLMLPSADKKPNVDIPATDEGDF